MKSTIKTDTNIYTPVLIPTLSRYEHLKRCIESLAKCNNSNNTDLYISVDYPPSEKYESGHRKILNYLENGLQGFSSVKIFYQKENLGVNDNFIFLLNKIRSKHRSFIYSEDDNVFSPNFLDYINNCLTYYKNNDRVIAISGYNYPVDIIADGNTILNSVYFSYHGCGMWISDYDKMLKDITVDWVLGFYKNSGKMRQLRKTSPNQYCNFVKSILRYTLPIINGNKARPMDLTCGIYMFDKNLSMAFPFISKIRNTGYDGTGEDCNNLNYNTNKKTDHRNYPYDKQPIDLDSSFNEIVESSLDNISILKAFDRFFYIPKRELIRTDIAYYLSRILGINFISKLSR